MLHFQSVKGHAHCSWGDMEEPSHSWRPKVALRRPSSPKVNEPHGGLSPKSQDTFLGSSQRGVWVFWVRILSCPSTSCLLLPKTHLLLVTWHSSLTSDSPVATCPCPHCCLEFPFHLRYCQFQSKQNGTVSYLTGPPALVPGGTHMTEHWAKDR